jgi:DNA gyrase subunit A
MKDQTPENKPLFVDQIITETLEKNYMPYVMSVIVSRAIPEIDGFKPSHRKILYTMYKMKLLKGNRTKSANVVGQTMKLNPHGDQAIYATLVRLSKGNESLLLPYVDSKGNFGKVTSRDMKFAAPRYTEVKLDSVCETIFEDIEKDIVEFVENYDGTMMEPTLLPTTFPNILANANKGIAVGMASNFPGFNLKELCDATIAYIKNPETDLLDIMPAPDFPTGGDLIYKKKDMAQIYESGVGSFKIRGKIEYIKSENMLEITEIPYTTTVEQIIEKVIDLIKNNRIKEISDIRDETDLKGLKIAIDLKRGADYETLIAKLFKYTTLEDSFACNFNLLIDGRPKVLGVKPILKEWIRFRRQCIRRRSEHDVKNLKERLHLLTGLKKVLLDIDLAIKIIRETKDDKSVIPNLMSTFEIDSSQADFIAEIKLRNLNQDYILNRISEIESLEKEIVELESLISSESKIDKVIVKDLQKVSKTYGKPRRSILIAPEEVENVFEEVPIEDYNLKVFFTAHNYLKKVSLISLRSSGEHKIKDDDEILQEIDGSNLDEILFFTNQSNVYKMKLHEIEDQKVSSLGLYLPNILGMDEGEEVIYCVVTNSFSGFMVFAFENGKVAKVPLESYKTKTNRKKLVKAYSDDAPLVGIYYLEKDEAMTLIREDRSGEYRAIIVETQLIPEKVTKNTRGVQAFRMKKGSFIRLVFKSVLHPLENEDKYVVNQIPRSGEAIDAYEKMKLQNIRKLY